MSYYFAALAVIILVAISHVLLKTGAQGKQDWLRSFLNRHTVLGYGLFLIVTVINLYALRGVALKFMASWVGLTYVLVVVLSGIFLQESLTRRKVIGCLLIALGLFIFSGPFVP